MAEHTLRIVVYFGDPDRENESFEVKGQHYILLITEGGKRYRIRDIKAHTYIFEREWTDDILDISVYNY